MQALHQENAVRLERLGTIQEHGVLQSTEVVTATCELPARVHEQTECELTTFDLVAYAHKHRYRLRNLHDGRPVPPARYMKPKGQVSAAQAGFIGKEDRYDAIVGYDGYICGEGHGQLGIYLHYRSARGVKKAHARIQALGGLATQVGDTEIAGTVSVNRIDEALKLIKVSKLAPGNPNARPPTRTSWAYAS